MKDIYNTMYNFGFGGMSFREQVETCAKIGFTGLEIFNAFDEATMAILQEFGMKTLEARAQYEENGDFKYLENMQKAGIRFIAGAEGYFDRESALRAAEQLNELGKKGQPYGFKAVSHNHTGEFCFNEQDGEYCWETVAKNTDPALVSFKLDIGWSTIAGVDSNYLMKKYPGRVELVHVKPATGIRNPDFMNMGKVQREMPRGAGRPDRNDPKVKAMIEESNRRTLAVQGPMKDYVRDLKEMMETAEACGALAMIIERDGFYLPDRVQVIKEDFDYVRSIWA